MPPMHRRSFLHGMGLSLALPFLESLGSTSWSENASPQPSGPGQTPDGHPLRLAYLYIPNGVIVNRWTPEGVGSQWKLNQTMEPLAEFQPDFQVLSGLEHKNGLAGKDGGGDHARACATILTGARPKKTAGSDIRLGISVDQVAAAALRDKTRFPSLELSCDGLRKSGTCDSGYSCAYQFNISWKSESLPMAPESNPRLVFERLFGTGATPEERASHSAAALARRSSLLDFVREEARSIQKQLGANDRQKLDEYLTGIREVEQRIQKTREFGPAPRVETPTPEATPTDYQEHLRLMLDLMVLAFQTDSTRVCTLLMAHDGSNRNFPSIGVSEGHHSLSHHQEDPKKIDQLAQIDRFYIQQLAYLLKRLGETREPNGQRLLDHSMIVYCGGLSDGNRHAHDNLPVILAGRGGGRLQPGRHVRFENTPMSNLHLALLDRMGVSTPRLGDSTGILGNLG
jgi:hypothetical protein